MVSIGFFIIFNIDGILFTLSLLRISIFYKLFKYWSYYAGENAKRIASFFKINSIKHFIYKAYIRKHGFFTVCTIFILTFYFLSLLLKVYEYYIKTDRTFFDLTNCAWFLVGTAAQGKK
jgi:hypothetical protein